MKKRTLLKLANVIAGLGALIFWFTPLDMSTRTVLCLAALAAVMVAFMLLQHWGEESEETPKRPTNPEC